MEKQGVSRISVSIPESLLPELDEMVAVRGFRSRSQAITEMINKQIADHKTSLGTSVMAGTINLVYDHSTPGLQNHLANLERKFIDEVISSLNVNLVDAKTLEVVLVQGPAEKLRYIKDQMVACKGVISGQLLMSAAILPQIHPLPETK